MTQEIPQEPSVNRSKGDQTQGSEVSLNSAAPRLRELKKEAEQAGQRGDTEEARKSRSAIKNANIPLSLDGLEEAARVAEQEGNTQYAQVLRNTIKRLAPISPAQMEPNSPINQATPSQTPLSTTNYPVGQGRQNLENYPISSNQKGQNRPASPNTQNNTRKGPTPSTGK